MSREPPPIPDSVVPAIEPSAEFSELWTQPAWREKTARFLAHATTAAAMGVSTWLLLAGTETLPPGGFAGFVLALGVLVGVWFVTIAIHEGGHFVAARLVGMSVLRVQLGSLELIAGRSGWRMRWRRSAIRVGGFVIAVADHTRPWRPQMLPLMAGGIVANLLAAALFSSLAFVLTAPWSIICVAIAVINAGLGLVNAFPTRIALPSDGMQLLAWWRGIPETHPDLVTQRLTSASVAGSTADHVSDADLAVLDAGTLPSQLFAHWIRLKAAQLRGDWPASAQWGRVFERSATTASPDLAKRLADLRWMAWIETAFSDAMATGRPDALRELPYDPAADWMGPCRWLRVQALLAAFDGNNSHCDALLAKSARWAEDAVDRAVPVSEEKLRQVVRSITSPSFPNTAPADPQQRQ